MKTVSQCLVAIAALVLCSCASSEKPAYTAESIIKAQQQSPPSAQGTALPVTSGAVPAPPAPRPTAEQYYPGEIREHWVSLVIDRGAKLKLEDDSVWEIAPQSQFQVVNWSVAEKITVARF